MKVVQIVSHIKEMATASKRPLVNLTSSKSRLLCFKRFLNSMTNVIPAKTIEKKVAVARTYSEYNVWFPETFRLFEEISDGNT